jgi:hypothetical protein
LDLSGSLFFGLQKAKRDTLLNLDMKNPMVEAQSQAASDRRNLLSRLRKIRSDYIPAARAM